MASGMHAGLVCVGRRTVEISERSCDRQRRLVNNMEKGNNRDVDQSGSLDVFEVADFLVSRAVKTYGDEIDIIGYYGSYAKGTARATSDLDIFYIPAEGKSPPVGHTFLIKGILFDFWAIRWATMEGFATGQIRGWSLAPSIVYHAKVLHARSEEQAARFAALKQIVQDLQKPEARPHMIQRALDEFKSVLAHLGNLRLAVGTDDLANIRHAGWKVILSVWECLALANQVFFDRGWGNIMEQIPRLHSRPEELEKLIITISTSDDPVLIADAAERLALGTRQVLREFQKSLIVERTACEVFDSAYPEIKDGIGKVLSNCELQRPVAASAAAWFVQYDLSLMLNNLQNSADHSNFNLYGEFAPLYRQLDFPDLMQNTSGDSLVLADRAKLLDDRVRQWLSEQSIDLCEFETLEEFERSI
jgi:hypothetical protein